MSTLPHRLDALVGQALTRELELEGKPGLVTPSARGSHADMDHSTFTASISALKGYFADCAQFGASDCGFAALQARGREAERAMFAATGGINTHKGGIFTLGLLAAAAGWQRARHGRIVPAALGAIVAARWGAPILIASAQSGADFTLTHGALLRRCHGLPGAREQAAAGFPVLFETTLAQLKLAFSRGADDEQAGLHALMATIAQLPDSNLAHRGGLEGLRWAQDEAAAFVAAGSVFRAGWRARLAALSESFVARWLSPGGSADLLAAAWLLHDLHMLSDGTDVVARSGSACGVTP